MSSIRLLIADDHPVVREGLAAILATQPDFEVVAEAADGGEALRLGLELRPDLLLLDLEMPVLDGAAVLRELRNTLPELRAIIFTAFDTDERILEAIRAGAQGYLLKGAPRQEIFAAVRTIHAGGSLLQPVVASKLMRQLSEPAPVAPTLTPREYQVLGCLARGMQNKAIARELGITERTVKFHIGSLLSRLGAGNRTEALAIAAKLGLILKP